MVYQERCKTHLKRFVVLAGGGMAHKSGVMTHQMGYLGTSGGSKRFHSSPGGGGNFLFWGIYATHAPL